MRNPLVPVLATRGFSLASDAGPDLAFGLGTDPAHEGRRLRRRIEEIGEAIVARSAGADVAAGPLVSAQHPWDPIVLSSLGPLSMGADLLEVSALDFSSMVEEQDDLVVEEGLDSFVTKLAEGLPILLDTLACEVIAGRDRCAVVTSKTVFSASRVLITCSTGVLASGAVRFTPELPTWKRDAIADLPMGILEKIAVELSPGALEGCPEGARVRTFGDTWQLEWILRPRGRDVAVALVGGANARAITELPEEIAVDVAIARLQETLGRPLVDHVRGGGVTSWTNDRLARGAYAYARPGRHQARQLLAKPVGRIHFAGEAAEHRWAGTLAGAYLSGRRAAAEIAAREG